MFLVAILEIRGWVYLPGVPWGKNAAEPLLISVLQAKWQFMISTRGAVSYQSTIQMPQVVAHMTQVTHL